MKKKVLSVSALGIAATLAIGGGIALSMPTQKQTAAALSVFKTSESVTAQAAYKLDSALQTDDRTGILLTAQTSGASIDFASAMSGAFEMDFRVFTQETPQASELEKETFYPSSDLVSMSIVFTDANDEQNAFSLVIDSSTALGAIPTARVETADKSVGIFRRARWTWKDYGRYNESNIFDRHGYFGNWNDAHEETKIANAGGEYAYLLDSSFSNVAWYKAGYYTAWTVGSGENAVENTVAPMRVGFDPVTMEVYGYSRGEKIVIWDLDERYNDGYDAGILMDGFESYSVSVEFTKLAKENNAANMVVYAVNGQSVTATADDDQIAPSVYAKATALGLAGQAYKIPAPKAYDLVDGNIAAVGVTVTDPDGESVACTGLSNGNYAADCAFTPTRGGAYTLAYTAKDAKGNAATLTQIVNVYAKLPASAFLFGVTEPENAKIGVGESAYVLCPTVVNEYFSQPLTAKVKIEKNGSAVVEEKPIAEKFAYTFAEAGVYTVTYSVAETSETYAYEVTVDAATPAYALSSDWATVYALNERIELPAATATLGENQAVCSMVVEFPDGTRYTNTSFTATVSGDYKVIYTAKLGSNTYELIKDFSVVENAAALFTVISNTEFTGVGVSAYNDCDMGLNVVSTGTGKIQYSRPINFNDKTAGDVFFEFGMTPQTREVPEASKLMITLTDVNDSMNFVQIIIHRDLDMYTASDIRAGAYGGTTVGLRGGSVLKVDPWGTMIGHSFLMNQGDSLKFSLDYASRTVYANGVKVADLDSPEYFKTLWNGFSEGLATLTFEVVTNDQPKVHYAIYSVDGNDLRGEIVADTQAPTVQVDTHGYDKDALPFGVVGRKYPLFAATAYDKRDGFLPCQVSCYYLLNGLKCEVDIKDGAFTPTEAKTYYIDYMATDGSGNRVVETLRVYVEEKSELSVALSSEQGSGKTGFAVVLPTLEIYGESGEIVLNRTVKKPDGTTEAFGDTYLPVADGEYAFEYVVRDYLGYEKNVTYTYVATRNEAPILESVVLPSFAVQGEALVFPDCIAYDYSDGTQKIADVTIKVTYDGKETTVENGVFTPAVVSGDATIKVAYSATSGKGVTEKLDYEIRAIRVTDTENKVDFKKLFTGESIAADEKATALVYKTETDGATLHLVRPVIANDVYFEFGIPVGYANFDTLRITLTDVEDPSVSFYATIGKSSNANKAKWKVSGDKTEYETAGTFGGEVADFLFDYDDSTRTLSASDENGGALELCSILFDSNGKAFNGFASGLVNVSFTFLGVTGDAAIQPTKLNNVTLENTADKDRTQPNLYITGGYMQYIDYGETLTVHKAVASDVLSSVQVTVTVIDPENNIIYEGAIDKAYAFAVEKYGSYLIRYIAKDAAGKSIRQQKFIACPYTGEVKVEVNGTPVKSAKVNQTVKLPAFTASSDHFEEVDGYIIVFDPNNSMKIVGGKEGAEYTFKLKGKYVVRYYAIDEDANYKIVDYVVTVS